MKPFLMPLAMAFFLNTYGQIPMNQDDSLELDSFITEIKWNMCENLFHFNRENIETDTIELGYTNEYVDSVLEINSLHAEGEVHYAPDSTFKIFVVTGEGIAGIGHFNYWQSYIVRNHSKVKNTEESMFGNIDTIYKMDDGKYLILDNSYGKDLGCYVYCQQAQLISFSGDDVIEHPIRYKNTDHFITCQNEYVEMGDEQYMLYDPKTKKLSYHYGELRDYWEYDGPYEVSTGYFEYVNGELVLKENQKKMVEKQPVEEEK